MEDDFVCDYDSTWESDGDDPGENQTRRSNQEKTKSWLWLNTSSRNMRAAKDMQNYRRGYPNLKDEECPEDRMINLKFYLNEYRSSPDDISIDSFLKEWKTDYKRLERVHSYIQWLFPLREPGVNNMASELTLNEIQAFKKNTDATRRLVESYELMLGFYGIRLVNQDTGEVERAENWKERFHNLERNVHNNLRITRILKSLGELGFEHYQAPLVRFFLEETLVKKNLGSVKRSVLDYFLFAVRNKMERKDLVFYAYQHYEPKDKFVWCPKKIQKQLKVKAAGSRDGVEEGRSQAKGREAETGASPKDEKDTPEDGTLPQKEPEDASALIVPPKPELKSLGDGNSNDNDDMDHSDSADPDSGKGESDMEGGLKDGSRAKYTIQETALVPETECEKPLKKKREGDSETLSNRPTGDLTNGQAAILNTVPPNDTLSDQTCLSEAPPVKAATEGSSKGSPSLLSEPGEKIPRTDFTSVPEEGMAVQPVASLETLEKAGGDQTNGKDVEKMDVESNTPNSEQDMGLLNI
ncbi:opioid growth factor receptor [Osmerus mordax]|uniref:opioid growth factor receptor n=1 Tax=Osmerus mordax TaxID=8014 RepID=UPI0035107D62